MKNNKIKISPLVSLGARNIAKDEKAEYELYCTPSYAVEMLLDLEYFNNEVWEPACGLGHISDVLEKKGYIVKKTDLIDRGIGVCGIDFLDCKEKWNGDIITNPPFSKGLEFVEKALELVEDGSKIAMFLKIQFLESKKRRELFKAHPPKRIYVSTSRIATLKNGKENYLNSAMTLCWFIWEKGFKGDPILKWFN